MKCCVPYCVEDARPGSAYCQECWNEFENALFNAKPAQADWQRTGSWYVPNPSEIYNEIQAIKKSACDSIMASKLRVLELEREKAELSDRNEALECMVELLGVTVEVLSSKLDKLRERC